MHDYRRATERGIMEHIKCENCNEALYISIGDNDEPVLKCFTCRRTYIPGLAVYQEIERITSG